MRLQFRDDGYHVGQLLLDVDLLPLEGNYAALLVLQSRRQLGNLLPGASNQPLLRRHLHLQLQGDRRQVGIGSLIKDSLKDDIS